MLYINRRISTSYTIISTWG